MKVSYPDGKYRSLNLDCLLDSESTIKVNDHTYRFCCKEDGSFESLKYEYFLTDIEKFFKFTNGYYNSNEGGFLTVFDNSEGKHCMMIGMYDAGGPMELLLEDIKDNPNNPIVKDVYAFIPGLGFDPYPDTDEHVIVPLDMTSIAKRIISFDGVAYQYVAKTFDEAYKEYQKTINY